MQYWEEEIQKISSQIEKLLPGAGLDTGDRLGDVFRLLLQGKVWEVLRILFHDMKGMIMSEAGGMVQLVVLLLGIGLIAALLLHFTELFENRQIADIGFYFVYLFLVLILIGIFEVIMETGGNTGGTYSAVFKAVYAVVFHGGRGSLRCDDSIVGISACPSSDLWSGNDICRCSDAHGQGVSVPCSDEWSVDGRETAHAAGTVEAMYRIFIEIAYSCHNRSQCGTIIDNACYRLGSADRAAKKHCSDSGDRDTGEQCCGDDGRIGHLDQKQCRRYGSVAAVSDLRGTGSQNMAVVHDT